jgi:hypothetical protein
MSDTIGRNVAFGVQKEAVRGTAIQSAIKWIGKLDFDFKPNIETITNESGFNHIAKNSRVDIIRRGGAGGLTSKIFDKNVGHIMTMAFGQVPTSTPVSGDTTVIDHVWALLNNNSHASYTLHTVEGDIKQASYPGAILDETTIDIVTDDYAKISSSFMSRKPVAPSPSLTPAYTEENEFLPVHASLKVAAYGADMDAAPVVADVTEAHLTISKNPTNKTSIGTDDSDPRNTVLEANLEIHLYYNTTTFRDYRDNQTKLAMRLAVENTDIVIGTAAKHPRLQLDFPLTRVAEWDVDYGADDLVQQTINVPVLLDLATGTFMTAKLTNLQASY